MGTRWKIFSIRFNEREDELISKAARVAGYIGKGPFIRDASVEKAVELDAIYSVALPDDFSRLRTLVNSLEVQTEHLLLRNSDTGSQLSELLHELKRTNSLLKNILSRVKAANDNDC